MAAQPADVVLKLEGSSKIRFKRYVEELKADASVLRIFRCSNGAYACHGENDLDLCRKLNIDGQCSLVSFASTEEVLSDSPDMMVFNRKVARQLTSEALYSAGKKVEVYEVENDGRLKMAAFGSPGNVGSLEEVILAASSKDESDTGATDRTVDDCGLLAAKFRMVKQTLVLGIAAWDAVSKRLSFAQVPEDAYFSYLESFIVSTNAKEVLFCEGDLTEFDMEKVTEVLGKCGGVAMTSRPKNEFEVENFESDMEHLSGSKLSSVKFLDSQLACAAGCGLLSFAGLCSDDTLRGKVKLEDVRNDEFLQIDSSALRALSLFPEPGDHSKKSSVFGIMDCSQTSMGSRLMHRWFSQPLQNAEQIRARQDIVSFFAEDAPTCASLRQILKSFPDIYKTCQRFTRKSGSKATLNDMVLLYQCSWKIPQISEMCNQGPESMKTRFAKPLASLAAELCNFQKLVEATIDLERIPSEYRISPTCSELLAKLREQLDDLLSQMNKEHNRIKRVLNLNDGLKLDSNPVSGHHFRTGKKHDKEVRSLQGHIMLDSRRNGLLFTTRTLKKLSTEHGEVSSEYTDKSAEMLQKSMAVAGTYVDVFLDVSSILAQIDVLSSFAHTAIHARQTYCRPEILAAGRGLVLKQGRHPVVEENMGDANSFIANDIDLRRTAEDDSAGGCIIVTGPNMGGKSTYIRTAGVATLLAHIGAYVPADEARIPLTDRILCRIGAHDDHHKAVSTFMSEMLETASILKSATSRSLVIIDELGRGTGTTDGFGLARAICTHLALDMKVSTLFATHFFELTALADEIEAVRTKHVAAEVNPDNNRLTFLYDVREGACEESFGVHVLEMCHAPKSVVEMARKKVKELEGNTRSEIVDPALVLGIRNLLNGGPDDKVEGIAKARELRKKLMSAPA